MKTILVVGGMGGIGTKIVEDLMPEYHIVVADRVLIDENKFPNVDYYKVDLTVDEEMVEFANKMSYYELYGIFFAAGIMLPGNVLELDYNSYIKTMNVNLNSVYRLCQLLIPVLLKESKSHIIMLASHLGVVGSYNLSAYSMSKAALIELAKCLALDFGDKGLMVNSISPAFVNTGMLNSAISEFATSKKWMFATGGLPKQRMNINDIVKVAHMLLEQESINGSNIVIDGAYTAR